VQLKYLSSEQIEKAFKEGKVTDSMFGHFVIMTPEGRFL
jgi:hypothetical protein